MRWEQAQSTRKNRLLYCHAQGGCHVTLGLGRGRGAQRSVHGKQLLAHHQSKLFCCQHVRDCVIDITLSGPAG